MIILMWLDLSVAQAILGELQDYKSHDLDGKRQENIRMSGCVENEERLNMTS